jgi:hypothetical protein
MGLGVGDSMERQRLRYSVWSIDAAIDVEKRTKLRFVCEGAMTAKISIPKE